jgi:ParB family transcriptional regulator, chromosome partitioning protein
MMTSAAEKLAGQVIAKKDEKVEKRRALGRGLESLLPGPRVVSSVASRVADTERGGSEAGATSSGGGGQQIPHFVRNDKSVEVRNDNGAANSIGPTSVEVEARRTGVSAPHEPAPREQQPTPPFAKSAKDGPPISGEQSSGIISIQGPAEAPTSRDVVTSIPLEAIEKNPYQTRYAFDEDMLIELRDSIKEHGVVQPVVVRPGEEAGRFILVLGERRLRASKMAGKETIPALVRRLSPQQAAEMTVLENVVREDLNPLEQAEAFRVLSKEFHLTQAQIAERIGVSRETVSNYMRLLRLPKEVMEYLISGKLSFSDCRELLALENEEHIKQVAEEVVTKRLKWDEIKDRIAHLNGFLPMPGPAGEMRNKPGARWVDPNVRAAQFEMERLLGVRVRIRDRKGKGKIVIEYATIDDYARVLEALRGKK